MTQHEEDAIIQDIITGLGSYDLGDIKFFFKVEPIKPLAIFILCACFIDHLAQFRYFDQIPEDKKSAKGKRFRQFVKDYMGGNKYQPAKLYDSLRSRLVHDYSTNGKYFLDWLNTQPHLQAFVDSKGQKRIMLQLENLIEDIETAFDQFSSELKVSGSLARKNALAHDKEYKILTEYKYDIKDRWE